MANNPTLKSEYERERRRIQSFIRRAKKRGFVFIDNPLPPRPKKITQGSINRLKKLNPEKLYKQSYYVEPSTGEALKGYDYAPKRVNQKTKAKAPKRTAAKKSNAKIKAPSADQIAPTIVEDAVLNELFRRIDEYIPPLNSSAAWRELRQENNNYIKAFLQSQINFRGRDEVAQTVQARAADLNAELDIILYQSSDQVAVENSIAEFCSIIADRSLSFGEAIEIAVYSDILDGE